MMEFCEHGTLTTALLATTAISHDLKHKWIEELALGLQHMHSLNVIHRDIKPVSCLSRPAQACARSHTSLRTQDNILIGTARGEKIAKYIDFGLAIEVTPGVPAHHGRAGTPGYMSPEVNQNIHLYTDRP